MKEFKVEVPKGYEIDKENSTFECIKFKERESNIKTIDDLRHSGVVRRGWYVNSAGCLDQNIGIDALYKGALFLTQKEAKSVLAASQISQLMPYYGGAITGIEWGNRYIEKYIIRRASNSLDFNCTYDSYHYLAFPTREQRDEFYENNKQLVKDYLMLD